MKDMLFIYNNGNAVEIKEKDFNFELAMEGYITDNPNLLSNEHIGLTAPEVKDVEMTIASKKRIDILLQYANDSMAVVELKNVPVNDAALNQLDEYLHILNNQGEEDYSPLIGILVGPEFEDQVLKRIENDKTLYSPIFAVELLRYFDNGKWFVFTKWHIPQAWNKKSKDYTKYILNGGTNLLGKGRLVFEVIKDYLTNNPSTTFADLRETFPDTLRTTNSTKVKNHVVELEAKVSQEDRYSRYFKETLPCVDGDVVVSSQWGLGNISRFIEKAKNLGYSIREVK